MSELHKHVSWGSKCRVIGTDRLVTVVDLKRPYGIPYALCDDGREYHIQQLERCDNEENL